MKKCTADMAKVRRSIKRRAKLYSIESLEDKRKFWNRSKAQRERWSKYKCYRQAFVNMGCKPMTPEEIKKSRATRPVDLHLTRKDAERLAGIIKRDRMERGYTNGNYYLAANRILNKLKREGVK